MEIHTLKFTHIKMNYPITNIDKFTFYDNREVDYVCYEFNMYGHIVEQFIHKLTEDFAWHYRWGISKNGMSTGPEGIRIEIHNYNQWLI